ncbi:MAG: P27 family phage terminase small subunit [Candidatus Sulfotelmatobacter sp.]
MSARISDELHELKGTRPTRAAAASESQFSRGRPKMPEHFAEAEAKVWKQIVKLLAARKTLTKGDGPAIEIYVETYLRHAALVRELKATGEMVDVVVLDSQGVAHTKRVANPASKLCTALANSLRQMLREFCGTPATREKSKPAKAAQRSETFEPGTVGWILQQRGQKFIGDEPRPNVVDEEPEMED